jgi:hypothetical protein
MFFLLYLQVSSSGIHLGDDDDSLSTKSKPKKPPPKIIQGKIMHMRELGFFFIEACLCICQMLSHMGIMKQLFM